MYRGNTNIGNLNIVTSTFTSTHAQTNTKQESATNISHDKVDNLCNAQVPWHVGHFQCMCVFCVDRERRATLGPPDSWALLGLQVHRVDQGHLVHLPQVLKRIIACGVTQFLTVTLHRAVCFHAHYVFCRSFFSWGKGGNGTSRSTRSL